MRDTAIEPIASGDVHKAAKACVEIRKREYDVERVSLSPEVRRFAEAMERQLRKKKNEDKGGWKDCDLVYLSKRIYQEVGEFVEAVAEGVDVLGEGADAANFLMMICDVKGKL